ncbi:hypothetical protein HN873_032594 [Arachis hypogaea]
MSTRDISVMPLFPMVLGFDNPETRCISVMRLLDWVIREILPSDWQMMSSAFLCSAMALMNPVGVLNQKVDAVADINPTKLAWNLKVGIVRLYEFPSKWNPREIYSMELVLQDERGDRIHCSISKSNMAVFRTLIREHELYAMKNFIVQVVGQSVRTTSHKYKLSFYTKTSISLLPSGSFLFNPFQFISYEKIEAMVGVNKNHLMDCMGHVIEREDVTPLVTKSGEESKFIKLHLEDLEENIMKCTLFGELVDKALGLFDKDDGQPIILVAQLFKPNFYLNEVNVQNSLYASRLFFNPEIPDVLAFKNRLIKRGDLKAQCVNYIQSQPVNSISDELHGGSLPITTIEEVLDKTNKTSCWILATVVSIEVGESDWYRLHVIAIDGTGCIGLIIWNQEAKVVVGKSASEVKDLSRGENVASYPKVFDSIVDKKFLFKLSITKKNLTSIDQVYNVVKISDDNTLIDLYESQSYSIDMMGVDQSVSNLLPASLTNEAESDVHSAAVVSLSKDSGSESIFECGLETPGKGVVANSNAGAAIGGLYSPDVQGSTTKPLKGRARKRKLE